MKVFNKIALRFGLFAGLLIAMNFIYAEFLLEADLQQYSPDINQIREIPKDAQILYLGESSNTTASPMDVDKRSISAFIGDYFPSLKVASITKPASHAGIYKTLLEQIPLDSKIKTVVITLNLRSFNAEWIHSELETQLQKSMILLKNGPPLYRRFLLSFTSFPALTVKEREALIYKDWKAQTLTFPNAFPYTNVYDWRAHLETEGIKNAHGERDEERTKLAADFLATYGFQIDFEKNTRIADFNEIIALAKKRNWHLVFNLLAENVDKADELIGKELTFLMKQNRTKLVHYFEKQGVTVVDNLETIRDVNFIDRTWPTEHYYEGGRKSIAKHVVLAIRPFHSAAYHEKQTAKEAQTHFTNDCEGQTIWGNMQSLIREEAYSGKSASKTDAKENYSIAFQYPYQQIPEEARNEVLVTLMVKGQVFNDDVTLMLDLSENENAHIWHAESLKDFATPSEKWQRIEVLFTLGERFKKANMINFYLLNLSGRTVYVDDIDIRFR